MDAILKAPALRSVSELCSFLGMINDYGKFIANMSTLVHPLKTLLKTGQSWKWDQECENAFRAAKQQLNSSSVLAQYNSKLPIRLAEDTSCYRTGETNAGETNAGEYLHGDNSCMHFRCQCPAEEAMRTHLILGRVL